MSTGNPGAAEEFGFPEMTSDIEMKPNEEIFHRVICSFDH